MNQILHLIEKRVSCIGDYAKGKDSGTIELLLVGNIDLEYLGRLIDKARNLVHRDIKATCIEWGEFVTNQPYTNDNALLLWSADK